MIDYGGIKLNIKTNADKTADKLLKCADAFDKLKKSASGVREDVGQVITPTKTAQVKKAISGVGDALAETGKKTSSIDKLKKSFKDFFTSFTAPAKNVKGFLSSIGRIALYRGIRTVLSTLTKSIKDGLTYLKEYSKAVKGTDVLDANGTLNTYTNTAEKIKAEIGASILPMVKAFIPVLKQISEYATSLFQEIALYTTWTTTGSRAYTYINPEYWDAVSEGFDDATQSAKELNKQLMKFDELNVISTPSSGSSEKDYSQYYKTLYATNEQLDNAEDRILKIRSGLGALFGATAGLKFGGGLGLIAGALIGTEAGLGQSGLDIAMGKIRGVWDEIDEWWEENINRPFEGSVVTVGKNVIDGFNNFINKITDITYRLKIAMLKVVEWLTPDKVLGKESPFNSALELQIAKAESEYQAWLSVINGTNTIPEISSAPQSWDRGGLGALTESKFGISTNPQNIVITVDDSAGLVKKVNGVSTSKIQRTGAIGLMETSMA